MKHDDIPCKDPIFHIGNQAIKHTTIHCSFHLNFLLHFESEVAKVLNRRSTAPRNILSRYSKKKYLIFPIGFAWNFRGNG